MTGHFPATFQRAGSSKIVGCLVYLVVAPFVALFLALAVAVPLMLALESLGVSEDRAGVPFLAVLPLIGAGVAVWGYHDYRRRAALEVVIDRDRVTVGVGERRTILWFEDVVSVRLVPTRIDFACVLVPRSGRPLRLPPEIAPFVAIRHALELTLIPGLVRRLDARVAAGESVALGAPRARLLLTVARAFGWILLGVLVMAKPWMIPAGVRALGHAAMLIRQSRLGLRGGLLIERGGARRASGPSAPLTPWGRLERIRSDPTGLVLRSSDGSTFGLSPLADDFWPALLWINARLR